MGLIGLPEGKYHIKGSVSVLLVMGQTLSSNKTEISLVRRSLSCRALGIFHLGHLFSGTRWLAIEI